MVRDWDAFMQQVEQWTQEMERFMAHVDKARAATLSSMALAPMAAVLWRPAVNVYETADAVVVQAELAGVDPEDVTIQYDSGRLLVWGQRRETITAEAQTIHRLEIRLVDSLSEYSFRRLSTLKRPKQPCTWGSWRFAWPSGRPTATVSSGSPWRRARGDRDERGADARNTRQTGSA